MVDQTAARFGGAVYLRCADGTAVIVVAPGLAAPELRWALAHELVHDDLGIVYPAATAAQMQRIEHQADRGAVDWLVPPALLVAFIAEQPDGEGASTGEVAEEFGVPARVVQRALDRLVDGTAP